VTDLEWQIADDYAASLGVSTFSSDLAGPEMLATHGSAAYFQLTSIAWAAARTHLGRQ